MRLAGGFIENQLICGQKLAWNQLTSFLYWILLIVFLFLVCLRNLGGMFWGI